MKIFFSLIKRWILIILGISAAYWISVPLGGPESVLKLIVVMSLYIGTYCGGLIYFCFPLMSNLFKNLGWNKNLAFAISTIAWLGVIGTLGVKFGETDLGMWLMDI